MNNKKTTVVSGRIPNNLRQQMIDEGLTVRDAVSLALSLKSNPNKFYEVELKRLLSEQEVLTNRLVEIGKEIDNIKQIANINLSDNELKEKYFQDEETKAIQNTLDYYIQWSYNKNLSIHDFIDLKSDVINKYRSNTNLSEEEFNLLLIEHQDKSKQTTFD